MKVGFSYIGLLWLIMLFVPNIFWIKRKPRGYEELPPEDRTLVILERTGQVGLTMLAPMTPSLNVRIEPWAGWLIASAVCMALYELWWVKYFRSPREFSDFYSTLFGIPLAGATLPCAAFALLAVYGKSLQIALFTVPLAIGHFGLHCRHKKESETKENKL